MDPQLGKKILQEIISVNSIEIFVKENFRFQSLIGKGGEGKVYKGKFNGKSVIVKILRNPDYKCLAHSVVILSHLCHSNIPEFYGLIDQEDCLALVSEYIKGKPLSEMNPDKMSNASKLRISQDIGSVLSYLHGKKIIHRDLKPENIIIDITGKAYLIDFGISKICLNNDDTITRARGSTLYLAPEVFDSEGSDDEDYNSDEIISRISHKVDIWAYGCIISWLFSGKLPWTQAYPNNLAIIQKALLSKMPFPVPKEISNVSLIQIIKLATNVDPQLRKDSEYLQELLNQVVM